MFLIFCQTKIRERLTKKHDESTDEAGERHADIVGVPLGRVGDDVAVVAGAEGESHVSGGENLNGKDDRLGEREALGKK